MYLKNQITIWNYFFCIQSCKKNQAGVSCRLRCDARPNLSQIDHSNSLYSKLVFSFIRFGKSRSASRITLIFRTRTWFTVYSNKHQNYIIRGGNFLFLISRLTSLKFWPYFSRNIEQMGSEMSWLENHKNQNILKTL